MLDLKLFSRPSQHVRQDEVSFRGEGGGEGIDLLPSEVPAVPGEE